MHVPRRTLIIAGAATLLIGGGTAAFAAITAGPVTNGVIHGCYVTQSTGGSHALVLQDKGTNCPTGDTAITWNKQGPTGAMGAPGTGATVTPLPPGNANCANGGASVADGNGNTAYACTGATGPTGPPASANFDVGLVTVTGDASSFTCGLADESGPDNLTITKFNGTGCAIFGLPANAIPTVTPLNISPSVTQPMYSQANADTTLEINPVYQPEGSNLTTINEFSFIIYHPSS